MSTLLQIDHLSTTLSGRPIHKDISLRVYKKEIIALVGQSGCGKTSLLRVIAGLIPYQAGRVELLGIDMQHATQPERQHVRQHMGMLFQNSALFHDLTVLENIQFPLQEYFKLDHTTAEKIARLKLHSAGLAQTVGDLYPAALSFGMKKRAAIARAIATDPALLLLDEPTAGLDPASANSLDELVLSLRDQLDLTVIMVTHDLDSLWTVPDRVLYLGEGTVLADGPMHQLSAVAVPEIQAYCAGQRMRKFMAQPTT